MTNLEKLTAKMIEIIPEIVVNDNAQIIHQDHTVEYFVEKRPITLEDVLIIIGEYTQLESNGKIIKINKWNGAGFDYICDWIPSKPLHLQSEETINFLTKILC